MASKEERKRPFAIKIENVTSDFDPKLRHVHVANEKTKSICIDTPPISFCQVFCQHEIKMGPRSIAPKPNRSVEYVGNNVFG